MTHPMDESETGVLRVGFDQRLKREFPASRITSDRGRLPFREFDDALGLTDLASEHLVDLRTGKNSQHGMTGLIRTSRVRPSAPVCRSGFQDGACLAAIGASLGAI